MYQRPEILEVGEARSLTLGLGGPTADNCGCSYNPEEDWQDEQP